MVLAGPLDDITGADLHALVRNRTPESERLEFIEDLGDTWNDATKLDILREVVSLANRAGGRLLYGVREDAGEAVELSGIADAVSKGDRLVACVRDNTARSLRLRTSVIVLGSPARTALLVDIPDSLERPHMITFKGRTEFWIKHGRERHRMTIDEIERAFDMRRLTAAAVPAERDHARNDLARAFGDHYPVLMFVVQPLVAGLVVDTRDEELRELIRFARWSEDRVEEWGALRRPLPIAEGVRFLDDEPASHEVRELWRSGLFAGFDALGSGSHDGAPFVSAEALARRSALIIQVAEDLYRRLEYRGPLAATLGLIKIEGHALEMEGQRGFQDRWDLALDPDVVPDSAIAPDPEPASLRSAFKIVLDGIAHAFHHEENIWFSATDGAVSARR